MKVQNHAKIQRPFKECVYNSPFIKTVSTFRLKITKFEVISFKYLCDESKEY